MRLFVSIIPRLALLALLVLFLMQPHLFEPVFRPLVSDGAPVIYDRANLMTLTLQHLGLVALATLISTLVAVAMAIFVTRRQGAEFLPLSRSLVNIGQTFPPVAVLALAVPVFGFGDKPTLIALFLYGLLPIFENTLTGLTTLPAPVVEAARGMGMTGMQRLVKVEMPLAMPVILAGIRLSAVIGLATATIGSTVAASTLGEVIIAGLISNNLAFVLQGGLVVAALAILIFDGFQTLEHYLMKQAGRDA
ncbi:ABC transporter permease [Brucella haematophila]|uniref:ABC transporter permease n=1 Tax=Brucella haematophila TaxID=419474 RepID=A0ABX1DP06_9HYPH|nr:ABC transporter permease [Brucella haematophila]NKC03307.1 ABC transporter permease [Brucella haematophila]TMV01110.1 ABC transporter permease [Brucella haematophila]